MLPSNASRITERDLKVPFDCLCVTVQAHGDGFDITEIYQIKSTLPMVNSNFGTWDRKAGFQLASSEKSFYKRRLDMKGQELVMRYTDLVKTLVTSKVQRKIDILEMLNVNFRVDART